MPEYSKKKKEKAKLDPEVNRKEIKNLCQQKN